jgi:hypothetical protein
LEEIETAIKSYWGEDQLVKKEMNATLALAQRSIAEHPHRSQKTRQELQETCYNAISKGRSTQLSIEHSIGTYRDDLFETIDSLQRDLETTVSTLHPMHLRNDS